MQENAYFCSQIELALNRNGILMEYMQVYSRRQYIFFLLCVLFSVLVSCSRNKPAQVEAPWGAMTDTTGQADDFDLDRIMTNGEMIMLTLRGPESYYDYRGQRLGVQYMLCQKFADSIGVRLRVDVCRDTVDMLRKLLAGDGDVIACGLSERSLRAYGDSAENVVLCGPKAGKEGAGWGVSRGKPQLAAALDSWYRPSALADVRREEKFLLSSRSVKRRVYSPMLNRGGGIISHYDGLFMTYCRPIRWDWKLMAAQCYQESTFDPRAKSWAGACGLMQIMPSTAERLGLPMSSVYDPESNIAAAAKLLGQLDAKFSDVPGRYERTKFVLAAYNGGYHHIRDAMTLAARAGRNVRSWAEVSRYVLLLSEPRYYQDPAVRYGYMRGSETVDYVDRIFRRWQSYRGVRTPRIGFSGMAPQKSKRAKKKYQVSRD